MLQTSLGMHDGAAVTTGGNTTAGPQVGDTVAGRVVWANAKGAKVQLLDWPGITAYMPARSMGEGTGGPSGCMCAVVVCVLSGHIWPAS